MIPLTFDLNGCEEERKGVSQSLLSFILVESQLKLLVCLVIMLTPLAGDLHRASPTGQVPQSALSTHKRNAGDVNPTRISRGISSIRQGCTIISKT